AVVVRRRRGLVRGVLLLALVRLPHLAFLGVAPGRLGRRRRRGGRRHVLRDAGGGRRRVAGLADRDLGVLLAADRGQVGARDVARRVEVVAERDRRARGERELDVAPVLAGRVVDDGPALEQRLALAGLGEDDAVRRLPH